MEPVQSDNPQIGDKKTMNTPTLKLKVLESEFTIHRFSAKSPIPNAVYQCDFFTISKTDDEISIVCDSALDLKAEKSEPGWSCFKVLGPLDFSLTGILAKISACLAEATISIFAISTYDTDYILIDSAKVDRAQQALETAGYLIER
jgi:uncharacterized protein